MKQAESTTMRRLESFRGGGQLCCLHDSARFRVDALIDRFVLRNDLLEHRPLLMHIDLYRLEPWEVEPSGVVDALSTPSAIKVVEWSERLPFELPDALCLRLASQTDAGGSVRLIERLRRQPPAEAPAQELPLE